MPSMTVILLSSEENEFSLLCFHILIYCLTTGKSGAENSALLVETCKQSPCRKQPSLDLLSQFNLETIQAQPLIYSILRELLYISLMTIILWVQDMRMLLSYGTKQMD